MIATPDPSRRTFDQYEGWAGTGALSTAAWLAWRTDIGQAAAREHVRVARALGQLPQLDAAFAAGQLSYSKVRAITRVAAESEQDFIDVALHATASQVEKVTAAYRRTSTDPTSNWGQPPMSQRRFVRRSETSSGMVRIEIELPPEQANVVWEALSSALDAGRRADVSAESPAPVSAESPAGYEIGRIAQKVRTSGPPPSGTNDAMDTTPGPMPFFEPEELSVQDLADIIAHLKG